MSEIHFRTSKINSLKRGKYKSLKMPIQMPNSSVMNSSPNLIENQARVHRAFKPIIIMAQCFALLPVNGVLSPHASGLRFSWRSFKVLYCCLCISSTLILSILSGYRLATTSINSKKTSNLVFFLAAGITAVLFLKLARQWPKLIISWESMDQTLIAKSDMKQSNTLSLSRKFKIISAIVMSLALVEHSLSLVSGYIISMECATFHENVNVMGMYFILKFPEIFTKANYALWKGVVVKCINVISTFSWNFIDLFLILISIAITDQFKYFNRKLYSVNEKEMPESWWTEVRIDYNHLATMTRQIDSKISEIVLLSFSTNLYFILIQLLNSFNPMHNILHTIYFCFSFGFLILRTAAISLYAANIHEQSLLPAPVLYSVRSTNFSIEVQRFLTQVTTDHISLTGMKFFSVTRSLILTVFGTIVTYELVLLQFNAIQDEEQLKGSNMTKICHIE